jgi:Zn finger protein HypA/HybF involved in hydrogenase expression
VSDGIYVDSYEDEVECKHCEVYNEVEVFFDPETRFAWWTCPNCGAENNHDESEDDYEHDDNEEDYE